ncbi:hypothetical protein TCON_0079 [Astathelohania contejeani]|uniref:G domain-containing protein n=1 Tax=Astathelohania contejeani TaxID=164912 RepID=A0ABQ7I2M2_9MICR|nr:hypothetical protein TCON_0079 [Thelohania contejeani]
MITYLIITLIITLIVFYYNKEKKKFIFIGPRNTGKTRTINYLLGHDFETVPTLEPYTITHEGYSITDSPIMDANISEPMDPKYEYFYFIRSSKDIDTAPQFKGWFVYYGDENIQHKKLLKSKEEVKCKIFN